MSAPPTAASRKKDSMTRRPAKSTRLRSAREAAGERAVRCEHEDVNIMVWI
jgi:hypothetical protein